MGAVSSLHRKIDTTIRDSETVIKLGVMALSAFGPLQPLAAMLINCCLTLYGSRKAPSSGVTNATYISQNYGQDARSIADTCILEIKHQAATIRERKGLPADTEIKVLPIDINNNIICGGVAARIHARRRNDYELNALLLPTAQISYRCIESAIAVAEKFASVRTKGEPNPQAFYVFLLFPSHDPQTASLSHHRRFDVPLVISSCYEIIGLGGRGRPAHSLSRLSTETVNESGAGAVKFLDSSHTKDVEFHHEWATLQDIRRYCEGLVQRLSGWARRWMKRMRSWNM